MLFWADIGHSYKGLSFQKAMQQGNRGFPPLALCIKTMNRGLISNCIFPELIGLKALYSKLFMSHVTPSVRNSLS
ncbi:hypothetical protein LYNGBM3L_45980 [Moorena producens 3L]|uniref:Uncharacterized protein n=1 Tax=Moorena producens 3L TaxID=489825 RepID=F4XX51_9CYAN|nr:hypothetical protein LYNGBM3L_45980 [Moorena producens 3L]